MIFEIVSKIIKRQTIYRSKKITIVFFHMKMNLGNLIENIKEQKLRLHDREQVLRKHGGILRKQNQILIS